MSCSVLMNAAIVVAGVGSRCWGSKSRWFPLVFQVVEVSRIPSFQQQCWRRGLGTR